MDRRDFLKVTATAALSFGPLGMVWQGSPNEKLGLGVVGVGNRGKANLDGVSGERIVALCDVDANFLGKAAESHPKAEAYRDFRKLLERSDLDAFVVSTPDHTHFLPSYMALRSGLHVYCEKPLTHTVREARALTEAARQARKATQMGTQIHAGGNYRRVVEQIRAKTIGPVREVHVFCDKNWGGATRPPETPAVPAHLDFDLWLGPAPARPYHPTYHPANWRRFWDFGGGTLGDMACHYVDLAFWALDLKYPTRVRAEGPAVDGESAPVWTEVQYDFPARGADPALKLVWYDGKKGVDRFVKKGLTDWRNGVLFVGDDGMLLTNYGEYRLLPEEKFADTKPPAETIAASIGHHREWIEACKGGTDALCHFGYSGPLTEAVLLGIVAFRTGETIDWDGANARSRGQSKVDALLRKQPRKGWSIEGS